MTALLAMLSMASSSSSFQRAATANASENPFVLLPIDPRHRSLNNNNNNNNNNNDDDQGIHCPPSLYGHVPSLQSNCQSFAFCSNGSPTFPTYRCSTGHVFDAQKQTCRPSSSSVCYPIDTLLSTNEEAKASYHAEKAAGPPVYWASVPDGTCVEGNVPRSIHPSKVFGIKAECCEAMLGWVDLGECLGDNFVERNYVLMETSGAGAADVASAGATTTATSTTATSTTTTTTTTPMLRTRRPTSSPVSEVASHVGSLTLNFGGLTSQEAPEESGSSSHQEDLEEPTQQEEGVKAEEASQRDDDERDHEKETQEEAASHDGPDEVVDMNASLEEAPSPGRENENPAREEPQSQNDDPGSDFIANMVNWANTDLDQVAPEEALPTSESASATIPTTTTSTSIAATSPALAPNSPVYQTTLLAIADGTVSSRRHDKNFGTNSAIAVDGGLFSISSSSSDGHGEKFDALLKFDISSISKDDDVVVKASIRLHSMNGCAHGGDVYVTHSDWEEDTLTWDSAPPTDTFLGEYSDADDADASATRSVSRTDSAVAPLASLGTVEARHWYDVDVTPVVALWRSRHYMAQDFLSVRISSEVNSRCMYASLEFEDDDLAPRLVVDCSPGDGEGAESSGPVAQSVGANVGNEWVGESSAEEREPAQAEISEIILSAAKDATLSNHRVNNNFGSHAAFVVDGGDYATGINSYDFDGERLDSIVAFDTSLLDRSRDIDGAVLKLYAMGGCSEGGSIYIADNAPWDEERVTWSTAPQAVGQAVADIGRTVSGEWYFVELSAVPTGNWASSDMLTLRIQSSIKDRCMYSSVEYGESTSPKLVITYGPSLTTAPPPIPHTTRPIVPQSELVAESMQVSPEGETLPCPTTTTMMAPTRDLLPVSGNFLLLVATDDATIDALSTTDDKLGTSPSLSLTQDVATRDIRDVLIRFDLSPLRGAEPRSALLTMFPQIDCDSAGTFGIAGGEDAWSERDVVWGTAPKYEDDDDAPVDGYGGATIGTFGRVEGGRWYGFTVVNGLGEAVRKGKTTVTFRISAGNLKSCRYASIESGLPPKLLVAF